jgi:hypothetical protein
VHLLEHVQVMCALVANDPAKQNWLRSAGLLQVLHRLTLGTQPPGSDASDSSDDMGSALGQLVSLSVRRQCARILAILAQQQDALVGDSFNPIDATWTTVATFSTAVLITPLRNTQTIPAAAMAVKSIFLQRLPPLTDFLLSVQGTFQGSGWQRWLEVSAAVEDCKLASHARRATLNLQSARTVATAEVLGLGLLENPSLEAPMSG